MEWLRLGTSLLVAGMRVRPPRGFVDLINATEYAHQSVASRPVAGVVFRAPGPRPAAVFVTNKDGLPPASEVLSNRRGAHSENVILTSDN
jgi:hypothetical protein